VNIVYARSWSESERGWGYSSDGYSLHLTKEDAIDYVKDYWDSMPDHTPDVYSFPSGVVFPTEVDKYLLDVIGSAKNGIREYNWSPNK